RRRHTRCYRDWSSDVCSSDLDPLRTHLPHLVTRARIRSRACPWIHLREEEVACPIDGQRVRPPQTGFGGGAAIAGGLPLARPNEIGRASCRAGGYSQRVTAAC